MWPDCATRRSGFFLFFLFPCFVYAGFSWKFVRVFLFLEGRLGRERPPLAEYRFRALAAILAALQSFSPLSEAGS